MRLQPFITIDLDAFEDACLSFIGLFRAPIKPGGSVLDPEFEAEIDFAVDRFDRWVSDRFDIEPTIRYALAWLLNLDEERFAETVRRMEIHLPVHGDFGTMRKFFELLWDRTFADWRVPRFDPDEYRIKGLPSA